MQPRALRLARLPGRDAERLLRHDAGRADPLCRVGRYADGLHAAGRRQQGHLAAVVRPGQSFHPVAARAAPIDPVEPGRRRLPSRIADDLYWLGRHVERAEGAVRLLRSILVRLTEKSGLADVPELPTLLKALTHQGYTYPGFVGAGSAARLAAPEEELRSVIFDASRPGSLQWTFDALHRVARRVRDQISADTWRVLHGLSQRSLEIEEQENDEEDEPRGPPTSAAAVGTLSDVLDWLGQIVIALTAFGGLAMESMTRGQGWRFLDMGRRLERATNLIGLVHNTLGTVSSTEGRCWRRSWKPPSVP